MVKLADLVGALLADAAQARVRADLEAVRIAEAYSANELLRTLPVPRFRLPDITVDLPLLIASHAASASPARSPDPPGATEIGRAVRAALVAGELRLGPAPRERIVASLAQRAKALHAAAGDPPNAPSKSAGEMADHFSAALADAFDTEGEDGPRVERARDSFRQSMQSLWAGRLGPSPSLEVLATAAEIKAHQNPESVVHVRLTITEDAYELVRRDDGSYLLTPE